LVVAAQIHSLGNDNFLGNETRGDAVTILVDLAVSLDEGRADFSSSKLVLSAEM
jgi:hypothetical protein